MKETNLLLRRNADARIANDKSEALSEIVEADLHAHFTLFSEFHGVPNDIVEGLT